MNVGDEVTFLRIYNDAEKHQAYLDGMSVKDHLMTGRIISQGPEITAMFVYGKILFINNSDIQKTGLLHD